MPTVTKDGQRFDIPADAVRDFEDRGYTVETPEAAYAGLKTEAAAPVDRGILGQVNAGATSLLSGATLGLSDLALASLATQEEREQLAADRAVNPITSAIGQGVGAVVPALVAPTSLLGRLPAGSLGRASAAGFEAGRAAGGIGGTARALTAVGAEGAIQNAGAYMADAALGDRNMTAEGMAGALGTGFAFGAAAGGVIYGIEGGTIAARRMFARYADGTPKAVEVATQSWKTASDETLAAHDAAVDVARARVREAQDLTARARLEQQRAKLGVVEGGGLPAETGLEGIIRAQGEAANPTGLESLVDAQRAAGAPDPIPGLTTDADRLAPLVSEYDAARVDFEEILKRLEVPEIEPGIASAVKVPRGQFDDLTQAGPLAQGTPVQVTTVGKKLGDGTPVGTFGETSGLDDLVRMQREASQPTGLESLVDAQRAASVEPQSLEQQWESVMARLKGETDVPTRRRLSTEADDIMERMELRGVGDEATPAVSAGPEPIAPGKTIDELKHSDETAENFVLRRMRTQGESFGDAEFNRAMGESKVFLGSLGIDWTVPENKAVMMRMMRDGKAQFARADLVGAMDPAMVKASEISDGGRGGIGGSSWHFIKDTGQSVTMPKATAQTATATDTLTGQLRSMQNRLGEGADLKVLGEPSRLAYATDKAAKTEAAAEHFRAQANAKNYAGSAMADDERNAFFANLTRPKTRDAYVAANIGRAMREEGSHAAGLARLEREWASGNATTLKLERHAIPEYATLSKQLDSTSEGYVEMTLPAREIASRGYYEPPGGAVDSVRVDKAKQAITEGQREAIKLNVTPDGKIVVDDGRHRLAAAIEADAPIKVKWSTGHEPSDDMVLRGKQRSQDLTRQLNPDETPAGLRFDPEKRLYHSTGEPPVPPVAPNPDQATAAFRRPSAVDDVASIAEAANRLEKAGAEIAEAVGDAAPPLSQRAAKAFRDAEAEAERKTMDRTTRAIDDAAEAPDPSRTRLNDANTSLAKARIAETEAKIGARDAMSRAREAKAAAASTAKAADTIGLPGATAQQPTRKLGLLADIGAAVEVASTVGIPGVPSPADIPIVGPLLSAYLKYRAVKAAAGRFVGRVPATAETRAATLASNTKDKIARAVDRSLGVISEAAPKTRAPAVAFGLRALNALKPQAFGTGEGDAPKDASLTKLAAARIREVAAAAADPRLIVAKVRKELAGVKDPDLIAAAEKHLVRAAQYLAKVAPKEPPPNPYSKREWEPSPAEATRFARQYQAAFDPVSVFESLHQQTLTPEAAETLRATSPMLFAWAQERLISRAGDLDNPVPYRQRLHNALLFQVPLDDSLQPENAAILATAHAPSPVTDAAVPQPQQPPVPAIAGPVNLTALYQPGSDRRAQMR